MTNRTAIREEAESHRKAGRYEEALPLVEQLWIEESDCSDGARLLHCLRKLSRFDRLRDFAEELYGKCPNHEWSRLELVWAYVSLLQGESGEKPLTEILRLAERVMTLQPEDLPRTLAVFAVLRKAKEERKWPVVKEWVDPVDPERLSDKPMVFDGKTGWSQRAVWYNYKINAELQTGRPEDAIPPAQTAVALFPRQHDFFQRLLAKSLCLSGNAEEGLRLYKLLCSNPGAAWWLRHEYGQFLRNRGDRDTALAEMAKAALASRAEPTAVRLIQDLGSLLEEKGNKGEAQAHFSLVHELRRQAGWGIPEDLKRDLEGDPLPLAEALRVCRAVWSAVSSENGRDDEREFTGRITGYFPDRKFCFINSDDGASVFVPVSLLPAQAAPGDKVVCRAVPAWDKKKMQDGWRAVSVTPADGSA